MGELHCPKISCITTPHVFAMRDRVRDRGAKIGANERHFMVYLLGLFALFNLFYLSYQLLQNSIV